MTGNEPALRTVQPANGNLHNVVSSLRNDRNYTDLEIHCQGKVFKVHKAIVCQQVTFFAACVNGKFKESQTGIIKLDHDIPEIVSHFIDFLYKESYIVHPSFDGLNRTSPDFPQDTNSQLLVHSHMYTLADKYVVPNLKKMAADKFESALNQLTIDKLHLLVPALEAVFEGPNDMVLQDMCAKKAAELYADLLDIEEFQNFCKDNGEAALAIMNAIFARLLGVQDALVEAEKEQFRPECPTCTDTNDVRVSSARDVVKYGGGYYCTSCHRHFTRGEADGGEAVDPDWAASGRQWGPQSSLLNQY